MLETIRSQTVEVGSNLRTQLDGGNWLHVLPHLDLGPAAVFGSVPAPVLEALERAEIPMVPTPSSAPELVVVGAGWQDPFPRAPLGFHLGAHAAQAVLAGSGPPAPRPLASLAVPTLSERTDARWTTQQRARRAAGRVRRRAGLQAPQSDGAERSRMLAPVGAGAPTASAVFGVVRATTEDLSMLPRYVRAAAAVGGVRLDPWRWSVLLDGAYRSQKVVFSVRDAEQGSALVVKVAREPAFTARTDNEHRALEWLWDRGIRGVGPRPEFRAFHAGRALIGEEQVAGRRFSEVTGWGTGDPTARSCIDALDALATRSLRARPGTDIAEALADLLDRYVRLGSPPGPLVSFLRDRIAELRDAHVPTVVQHGDPGTWNVIVAGDGEVRFLDWENTELCGVPTWDLSFFLHAYALRSLEQRGHRRSMRTVEAHLLAESPWSRWHAVELERYADRLAMPRSVLPALHVLGWLYQAVKDLPRRPAATRPGHADDVLRGCWMHWGTGLHARLRSGHVEETTRS